MKFSNVLNQYDYDLPPGLIAHEPIEPRSQAKLLVYDTKSNQVSTRQIYELPELLKNTCLVYNDTKVFPARLKGMGERQPVELLVLVDQGFSADRQVRALVNRFTPIGEKIIVNHKTFTVLDNQEKSMLLQFSGEEAELFNLLLQAGETPLPPYIYSKHDEQHRRIQYQTMFADKLPSVAAPTASLHFTPELVEELKKQNNKLLPVSLQVGLGTFAPVFEENFHTKKLHRETFAVSNHSAEQIKLAKETKTKVMAVGTTALRTLESAAAELKIGEGIIGNTDLFIFPPYHFQIADILLTNFHVPRSSLMCLVDAFIKDKGGEKSLIDLYKIAIDEKFRFYSFGDAMLIL